MNSILNIHRERFDKILEALNEGIFERKNHINKAFLAAMSGEAIFLLGPPGVAKSLIARRLKYAFKDANSFEYLMNRFSTPEEIFGPLSISKLRDEDKLERKVENYLPNANIAFLDEIWKAGPSIQNTLLTIINEKIFRNGSKEINVPLIGLIAASNELPTPNMGLEALWDRFIIRMIVKNIEDSETFASMITSTDNLLEDKVESDLKITLEEYNKWQKEISKIKLPKEIIPLIHYVRVLIQNYNQDDVNDRIYISDRRWKKIINVLRTSAYINGRDYVDLMDCFLIEDMIWDKPSQIDNVKRIVREALGKNGYSISVDYNEISSSIESLHKEIKNEIEIVNKENTEEYVVKNTHDCLLYEIKLEMNKQLQRRGRYNNLFNIFQNAKYVKIKGDDSNLFSKINTNIYLYDSNINHIHSDRISAHDSNGITTTQGMIFKLKTNIVKNKFVTYKKPHQLLVNNWNSRSEKLKVKINEVEKFLEYKENNEFASLKFNLFVEGVRSEIILENLELTKKNLKKLLLKIDEIKHYYENVKEEEINYSYNDDDEDYNDEDYNDEEDDEDYDYDDDF